METQLFKLASDYIGVTVTPVNYESVLTTELLIKTCLSLQVEGYCVDVFKNSVIIYKILPKKEGKAQVSRSNFSSDSKLNFIEALGQFKKKSFKI